MLPALTEPWQIADVEVPNRVVLAPLAGIGTWFVRLQAKRYGAGLATSEMVSSFAIAFRNELGQDTEALATGGLPETVVPFCETIDDVDDLLTLTGLRLIHERNRPS